MCISFYIFSYEMLCWQYSRSEPFIVFSPWLLEVDVDFEILDKLGLSKSRCKVRNNDSACLSYLRIYPKDGMGAWTEVWAMACLLIITFPAPEGVGGKI